MVPTRLTSSGVGPMTSPHPIPTPCRRLAQITPAAQGSSGGEEAIAGYPI